MSHNNRQLIIRGGLPGRSDIYTLLMLIACLALLVGIGFVWYRSAELFNSSNPFEVVSNQMNWLPLGTLRGLFAWLAPIGPSVL